MPVITIIGGASGRSEILPLEPEDLELKLLTYLRQHGITIASSCNGESICKKCVIQNGWLTCELTLEEFLKRRPDGKIFVSYL